MLYISNLYCTVIKKSNNDKVYLKSDNIFVTPQPKFLNTPLRIPVQLRSCTEKPML